MPGMNMPGPNASKPPADAGHAGHDMSKMKMPPPAGEKPPADAGHDMGGMPMPADKGAAAGEVHLMGVVTRVAGSSLIVTRENGRNAEVLTDRQTTFERGEKKESLKGIKPGERVVIYATPTGARWLARVVKLSASTTSSDEVKRPDAGSPSQAQQFTCPMHPEVRSPVPGKCPKCGMKLQPVGPP